MVFTELTDADRKRNQYLDQINHAPYSAIFFTMLIMLLLVTVSISIGAF
ncbi:hypothetical protein B6N60_00444 [Richelia sinica FACHB-800]|uniref:Uncharacterized protein n=2 Tax=Richelia TaxID=98443 RepID=A0A975Y347_9NOST|nr:hypothetical protein B6N60_00444 [Richelia sinica FACHB-800]